MKSTNDKIDHIQPGMPFRLKPSEFISLTFDAKKGDRIHWEVKAEGSLSAYLMDYNEFILFLEDKKLTSIDGHEAHAIHSYVTRIPRTGKYTILINNISDRPLATMYEFERHTGLLLW
jgi:hypothetical protein